MKSLRPFRLRASFGVWPLGRCFLHLLGFLVSLVVPVRHTAVNTSAHSFREPCVSFATIFLNSTDGTHTAGPSVAGPWKKEGNEWKKLDFDQWTGTFILHTGSVFFFDVCCFKRFASPLTGGPGGPGKPGSPCKGMKKYTSVMQHICVLL